jgi:uncharacterized OB-fold protein
VGELRLQRCNSCGKTFLPLWPFCPSHVSLEVSVIQGSGKGRIHSYFVPVAPPSLRPVPVASQPLVALSGWRLLVLQ